NGMAIRAFAEKRIDSNGGSPFPQNRASSNAFHSRGDSADERRLEFSYERAPEEPCLAVVPGPDDRTAAALCRVLRPGVLAHFAGVGLEKITAASRHDRLLSPRRGGQPARDRLRAQPALVDDAWRQTRPRGCGAQQCRGNAVSRGRYAVLIDAFRRQTS